MSTQITNHFETDYATDVHVAYQQKGSKIRNTIRLATGVTGSEYVFKTSGKGKAGKKTRHGNVPLMDLAKGNEKAILSDWYAAEYYDNLDVLKAGPNGENNERTTAVDAGAWALGRKVDEIVIGKMDGNAVNVIPHGTKGLTKTKILSAFEVLTGNDVAFDGNVFGLVGPHQWNELLNIEEFKNSDYAGDFYPWLKGTESKTWLGITWMFHTGLTLDSGNRLCHIYHKTALGLAEGSEVKAFVDWVPEKAAHLVDHMISAGATLIDSDGIVTIECDDDAEIAA